MTSAKKTEAAQILKWLPERINGRDVNKGTFGHVLVLSGSAGLVGSAVMVAEASARVGAGLVTLAVPQDLQAQVVSKLSPAIMTRGLKQTAHGTFAETALPAALELTRKATVVALGPGLGTGDQLAAFVCEFVARCPVPLVLDADGLNLLSQQPDRGESILKSRTPATVLTPHPGELGRLLSLTTADVQRDRPAAIELAVKNYGCVVLLKGAQTLILDPDGNSFLNSTGNPGMATGGTGDVLTGVIAGLLAQHLDPLHAAVVGAYLHGKAGDLFVAETGGCTGLMATDLIGWLPKAIASCQRHGRPLAEGSGDQV